MGTAIGCFALGVMTTDMVHSYGFKRGLTISILCFGIGMGLTYSLL